jgi:hypothetical protein
MTNYQPTPQPSSLSSNISTAARIIVKHCAGNLGGRSHIFVRTVRVQCGSRRIGLGFRRGGWVSCFWVDWGRSGEEEKDGRRVSSQIKFLPSPFTSGRTACQPVNKIKERRETNGCTSESKCANNKLSCFKIPLGQISLNLSEKLEKLLGP